jgi:hypothetical protein
MPGVTIRSAFERGREFMDQRDWSSARRAFEDAVPRTGRPGGTGLARANLAVAETLEGDLQAAASDVDAAKRIESDALAGHLAGLLLFMRQARFAAADREADRGFQLFPDRNLSAFSCDLKSALRAGDDGALARLGGVRAELLVLDLLR